MISTRKIEKVAEMIIYKYLKKGNLTRCMRDILPQSGLSDNERNEVAEIVHNFVRWKRLYRFIIEERNLEEKPRNYVKLFLEGAHENASSYPFEYKYSLSDYMAEVLRDKENLAAYLNQKPPTTLCVNLNKSSTDEVIEKLKSEGIDAKKSILKTAVITSPHGRYSQIIKEKKAHVQDENSQLISLITVNLGNSILDYCAGNGGKTLSMASMSKNSKLIHCYDVSREKLKILKKRCEEYYAKAIINFEVPKNKFDVVLVDAPCTGVGVARRNPDAKYINGPEGYTNVQLEILKNAFKNVKDGGYLIYAVCSFLPEETDEVVKKFREIKDNIEVLSMEKIPMALHLEKNDLGFYTNIPNGDIFYISVVLKKGSQNRHHTV